jgi:hypothetical protein
VVGTCRSEPRSPERIRKAGRTRDDASSARRAVIWPKGIGDLVVSIFAQNDRERPTLRIHLLGWRSAQRRAFGLRRLAACLPMRGARHALPGLQSKL